MEFHERNIKPQSNKELLYQQVLEQSGVCDVIIQAGQWRKKFHWCVLVKSPFFESIRRNDFIEQNTGVVNINVASPLIIESAILFLYDRMPKLTEENAKAILELSEFFMMPNLKSSCVSYFEKVPITIENCINMLELSNMYSLKLGPCYKFIRGHLKDILQRDEAIYLTKELVITLLTNPFLSYVTAEEKFIFAVKWADGSEQNKSEFPDILKAIDLDTTSKHFFETVVLQNPHVVELSGNSQHVPTTRNTQPMHRVLCFPGYMNGKRMACLDLDDETWCGVETWLPKDKLLKKAFERNFIEGVQDSPIIYRKPTDLCCKIVLQNLHSRSASVCKICKPNNKRILVIESCFCIYGETLVTYTNVRRRIERRYCQTEMNPEGSQRSPNGEDMKSQASFAQNEENPKRLEARVKGVTVYCGPLEYPTTHINPIFTIRGTYARLICINSNNMIALIAEEKDIIYIYDTSSGLLDTISFSGQLASVSRSWRFDMKRAATDDGFILYNYNVALSISRLHELMLADRYSVKEVKIVYDGARSPTYFYSNNTWIRFLNGDRSSEPELTYLSHNDLTNDEAQTKIWKQLPYPNEFHGVSRSYKMFMINLPVSRLNCPFSCRHCDRQKEDIGIPVSRTIACITDEDMYAVSSDEDNYY